jgi:hypothetical protein
MESTSQEYILIKDQNNMFIPINKKIENISHSKQKIKSFSTPTLRKYSEYSKIDWKNPKEILIKYILRTVYNLRKVDK